uniref:Uncharacterized protein n=1 Tax=Caenorhabditis japonica TaxID=281687 RepID=A0A8R1IZ49_CAEJA
MPVILVDSLKDWTKWIELARAWWPFFVYGLAITHVCMTSACYILIAVAYERYLITLCNPELRKAVKRSFTHKAEHHQKIQQTFSLIAKILV